MNYIRCKAFAGGPVLRVNALSLVGGKAGMVKAVQDVEGGLADPAASKEVCSIGRSFGNLVFAFTSALSPGERRFIIIVLSSIPSGETEPGSAGTQPDKR